MVSSSVEWNASMSEIGRRSMKPTVSVRRNLRFENSTIRVVVESVVNSDLSTRTVSVVNELNRVLLPALVYPASEIERKPSSCRRSRCRFLFSLLRASFLRVVCTCRLMASR